MTVSHNEKYHPILSSGSAFCLLPLSALSCSLRYKVVNLLFTEAGIHILECIQVMGKNNVGMGITLVFLVLSRRKSKRIPYLPSGNALVVAAYSS